MVTAFTREIDCDVKSYTTSFFEDDVRDVMWFDNTKDAVRTRKPLSLRKR